MTPKEKAYELYLMYYNRIEHTLSNEYWPHEKEITKMCALEAIHFAKGCIKWNTYPLDVEWAELNEIEKEIYKL